MTDSLRRAVERATGRAVRRMVPLGGGDTASSFRIDHDDGAHRFVKSHASPPDGFFTTESAGLEWLRAAGAVPVPTVIAVSDGGDLDQGAVSPAFLVLEWITRGASHESTDAAFGTGLALLHDAGAPCFGRRDRRTTGSLGLPNEPCVTWASFVAANRLLPLARIARDRKALPVSAIARLERLAGRLKQYDDGEPPARLHGDLWAGNRMVDADGTSWLIDPACHGGHREFDLAMMRLFGGFSAACFDSYQESHPLGDGWADRVALHQIAPLVVHAIKFGGGYVAESMAAIDRFSS